MDALDRLERLFTRFPGIGPRQSARFVQSLLRSSNAYRRELADAILTLEHDVRQCPQCRRFHSGTESLCSIDRDSSRDHALLAVVAQDHDIEALERAGFGGYYFVIGALIELGTDDLGTVHASSLARRVKEDGAIAEVIFALPANTEGDATAQRVREYLRDNANRPVTYTMLGRGLSTGSEIEYADPDTIKNALRHRE